MKNCYLTETMATLMSNFKYLWNIIVGSRKLNQETNSHLVTLLVWLCFESIKGVWFIVYHQLFCSAVRHSIPGIWEHVTKQCPHQNIHQVWVFFAVFFFKMGSCYCTRPLLYWKVNARHSLGQSLLVTLIGITHYL